MMSETTRATGHPVPAAMRRAAAPGLDPPFHAALLASALTGLAGFLDAIAYAEIDRLYVSFMSGNSTHLGMAIASGSLPAVLAVLAIVAAFVAGATLGTWISDRAGERKLVMVLCSEVGIIAAALVLTLAHGGHAAFALVAIAMGMQNVLHQVVAGADVGKGFITGALFAFGQSMARLFRDRDAVARSASNMLSWCAFVGGAALGTLAFSFLGAAGGVGVALAWLAVVTAGHALGRI